MSLLALPLRLRITLGFVAVTGCVLVALGAFLHQRFASELDASLRDGLRTRAGDLAAEVRRGGRLSVAGNLLVERGDDLAQILDSSGRVLSSTDGAGHASLLAPAQLARARRRTLEVARRPAHGGEEDDARLVAAPAGDRVVVVGANLEARDEALGNLDRLLFAGLPAALLLSAVAGHLVAGGALRPVERIRRRADAIGTGDLSERLPAPRADDELRRLAQTLNAMLGRLEDGFTRERRFVADASHELRTPLARLRAEMELASAAGRSPQELRAAIASAVAETDQLAQLADDLLVLARADQGRLPVRTERIDLCAFLGAAAVRADPSGAIGVRCDPGTFVEADPLRLQQAVGNLLDNAARHGRGPIELHGVSGDDGTAVHVVDHGAGVPVSLEERAFDRFVRADDAREGDGAGLGLAIVSAIARAHGGTAGIARAPGGGADVWIRLPAPARHLTQT